MMREAFRKGTFPKVQLVKMEVDLQAREFWPKFQMLLTKSLAVS